MANRAMIKDPDLIYPGQKFTIPPVPKRAAEGVKPAETVPADKPKDGAPKADTKAPAESGKTAAPGGEAVKAATDAVPAADTAKPAAK